MGSKTPRTDAESRTVKHTSCFFDAVLEAEVEVVDAKFARQLETELADARAEVEWLNKQLDEFWEHLSYGWAIEPRTELERIAKESWNPPNPLLVALHYIWKREAKTPEKDALIEQMREALKLALTEARSTHCENTIKAALEAAKRGE